MNDFSTSTTLVAVVLAGGQATRMQGLNKAFVPVQGKPMIRYVLDTIQKQVDRVVISANRDFEKFESLGSYLVFSDMSQKRCGPLSAIEALVQKCVVDSDWIVLVPCDAPWLPKDLIWQYRKAYEALSSERQRAVEVIVPILAGRNQNTFAMIKRDALMDVGATMASGDYKLGRWLEQKNVLHVPFLEEIPFTNFNRLEEVEEFEKIHGIE